MIDTHCHLNFKSFSQDFDAVIKQAEKDGVKTIINVGTEISSSKRAVELAEQYENLYAIVGAHPHHADKVETGWLEELEEIAKRKKVVAIGEIGMDYFNYKSNGIVDPKVQKDVFLKQIEVASRLKLPLQIHNRHAGKDIIDILKANLSYLQDPPGMFHCMSGDHEHLKAVLDLGFYVGFDGNITYDGISPGEKVALPELVKCAPLDRIVTETDSPYLTPIPHRGSRNIPSYVIIVVREVARIKNIDFAVVSAQTEKNAQHLFGL